MTTLRVNELLLPSVDDVSSALEGSTWNADFSQLDRGRQQNRIKFVGSSQTSLLRFELGNRVRQLAEPGRGTLNFGIPTRNQTSGRFGRRILESETLTCFDPSSGFEVISEPGFSAFVLTFPSNRLSELAEMLELPDLPGADHMLGTQRYPSAECLSHLRGELQALFVLSGHTAEAVRRNACREIDSDLPVQVLQTWFEAQPATYTPPNNRSRVVRRAQEYIRSQPRPILSVEALCRASACSVSTLERAFRDHFGIPPKQYLLALRLSGARRAILAPEDQRMIGDIACEWGFWHLSKFAADYQRMFGELPSATRLAAAARGARAA